MSYLQRIAVYCVAAAISFGTVPLAQAAQFPVFTMNPSGATPTSLNGTSFSADTIQYWNFATETFTGFAGPTSTTFFHCPGFPAGHRLPTGRSH